jgi:hypothetical protein
MPRTVGSQRIGPLVTMLSTALLLSPVGVSAQDASGEPLPDQGTALEAGRYVSDVVGPSIDFRVEDGWVVGASPPGPIFSLERTDQPGTVLTFTRFDGEVFVDSCDSTSMTQVDADIRRLGEVIGGNPYLNPGPPNAIEVDGYPGIWFDVGVPAYTECSLPFLLLWALPIDEGGEFVQVADQQTRFILVDVDGDAIVIAIESFPGVPFGGLLDASMEIVRSMHITPGEYVPPAPSPHPDPVPSPTAENAPDGSPGISAWTPSGRHPVDSQRDALQP